MENLTFVYKEIMSLPKEANWVQFKNTECTALEISELIPLIAHYTYLAGKDHGYIVWRVERETSHVVGTAFKPYQVKKGKKNLIAWLSSLYQPNIELHFLELIIEHKPIVILEIGAKKQGK
jgi:predicted HTH transcriptional regulator